ncbi:hypothetical protein PR048_010004 [Dryococelus australis]|uniref:DUF4371 domain-containing protein n=1 Tax=Dryococelus australis TaxID=614101 RepID=A0ABQ9I1G1_9NEOP|nr:hypothetical protein PR048_010004 [Dryococelus australis]
MLKARSIVANIKCQEDFEVLCKTWKNRFGRYTSRMLHNIPLNAADHAGLLLKKMFLDSEIAKKYGCICTKTSAIVKEMDSDAKSSVIQCLQNALFSVSTDGSSDTNSKLYPMVVTFYDGTQEKIVNSVLSTPALGGDSTGWNIGT